MAGQGGSVIVGDQGALDRGADGPVVPDRSVEREQALDDPDPQAGWNTATVLFQAELALQDPDDRFHPLAQPVRRGRGRGSSVRAGRIISSPRSARNRSVAAPARPLSVTTALPAGGRLAGWETSSRRTASRSPTSLGLAKPNPVTVPSAVQNNLSLTPQ